MKLAKYLVFVFITCFLFQCDNDPYTYAEIETSFGTMKLKLYNTTPKHRDNFIKLANEGYYDDLLFHRVIKGFMIQGGDPNSRGASQEDRLGFGGPGYKIDPEIGGLHIRGALAMAQDGNPQKQSSGSQFYIVHGNPANELTLNKIQNDNNIQYSDVQKQMYMELGGAPFLDNQYTVFGELIEGFEVLDKIASTPVGRADRPVENVTMKVRIIN